MKPGSSKAGERRPPRFALAASHLLLVAVFSALFLLLSYVPLRATDLWGHVSYGDWIREHRALPAEDPFMHLARGVPVVDSAWLSQVLLAAIHDAGGGEWLSNGFALTVLATYLIWAWIFYRQNGSPLLSFLGTVATLVVSWSRLFTIRPENFGALCFAVLFWLLLRVEPARPQRWPWISVPVLIALWANLHGSFLLGLVVLGCFVAGHAVEVAVRTRRAEGAPHHDRRIAALVTSRSLRRWLALLVLGLLATLVNPYGVGLVLSSLSFGGNENLPDILEWQRLAIAGVGGREFVLSWVVLLLAFARARRSPPIAHLLLLIVFGLAVVSGVRFIGWYAPIFALVLVQQLGGPRSRADAGEEPLGPGSGLARGYALAALALILLVFSVSPISRGLLGRPPRTPAQLYGDSTPLAVTRFLRRNQPRGQVFHPQHWGDWLVREGPRGLSPFITLMSHLVPRSVWIDYLVIAAAESGWEEALDRYQVTTVIVDRRRQGKLAHELENSAGWRLLSPPTDPQALVFGRVAAATEGR